MCLPNRIALNKVTFKEVVERKIQCAKGLHSIWVTITFHGICNICLRRYVDILVDLVYQQFCGTTALQAKANSSNYILTSELLYYTVCLCRAPLSIVNPLTAGAAYIRVFILY